MSIYVKVFVVVIFVFGFMKIYQKQKIIQKKYIFNMIIFSRIWLLFAAIFSVCFLISGFLAERTLVADIVLLVLMVSLVLLSILFLHWHIDFSNKRIEYGSLLWKNYYRDFDKTAKVEIDEKDNICIYSENEKVLKIPASIGQTYIIAELKHKGISIRYKYNVNDFVMKLPLFYPVMHITFSIIAGVFTICSIQTDIFPSILLWFIMMWFLIYKTVSDFWGKTIVYKGMIVQIGFLKKTKKIRFAQITKVVRREKNNIQYVYIYSEKGLEMRINMLCENRRLLEELIKQHRWER